MSAAKIPGGLPVRIDELTRTHRKTLGITVAADGRLIVRAPKRLPLSYIEAFIRRKSGWILEKQQQMREAAQTPRIYAQGERFYLLGQALTLQYDAAARRVCVSGDRLILPDVDMAQARKLLEAWYRGRAREVFAGRIVHFAQLMGVQPGPLRISGAKGRWGSCGAAGGINLVWRLVMAPLAAVDYVVVHELAHLKRRDHSAAFWQEVARILPAYAEQRRYLGQQGQRFTL